MTADSSLSALTIGALSLTPAFDPETLTYAVNTMNASNKVTATAAAPNALVTVKLSETEIENGSSPTWETGENTLTITVTNGTATTTYTVTVTKTGE